MTKRKSVRNLSRGVRKHIRGEKAKIRRNKAEPAECERLIAELYARFGFTS